MGVTCIHYNEEHRQIERILSRVDRFGDYCTSGCVVAPMPSLEVQQVGMISFPVPSVHIEALIRAAKPAPYGRGSKTILDRAVRDCWQIDASKVQVGGPGWNRTFETMLKNVAEGLGCPHPRLEARLYKLLIYETGGFFAEHRDSEKVAGMVGTLVISLPAAGSGGDLIVRHGGRETAINLCVGTPSQLAYGAFYSDCTHETVPLRDGHRVSLVYNLVLKGKREKRFARAPVFSDRVEAIAARLTKWARGESATRKIVWVLDHGYSSEGLSFDLFKGLDEAVAQILAKAARTAQCSLHAAILHVEETGIPYDPSYGYYDDDSLEDLDMDEVVDWNCWLDRWVAEDGSYPTFGEIPLADGELLPTNALDAAEPDDKLVHEASGNEGVTIEHTYRNAALVIWPSQATVAVLAQKSIEDAIAFIEARRVDAGSAGSNGEEPKAHVPQLLGAWASAPKFGEDASSELRSRFLRLLADLADESGTTRFLTEIAIDRYSGGDNDALIETAIRFGPRIMEGFLPQLVKSKMDLYVKSVVNLTWRLWDAIPEEGREAWRVVMRAAVHELLWSLPRAFREMDHPRPWQLPRRESVDADCIARILQLGWRFRMGQEVDAAALLFIRNPENATPDRDIPAALSRLGGHGKHSSEEAYRILWCQAAEFLLERSAQRPEDPRDWRIETRIGCDCEPCRSLQAFCDDRFDRKRDFKMNQYHRNHLENQITRLKLPMDRMTVTYGRPYTLVCTKNRADHRERLDQYKQDIEQMGKLVQCPPDGETAGEAGRLFWRLRSAHQHAG